MRWFGVVAAVVTLCLGSAAAQDAPALRADGTQSGITVSELAQGVYQFHASRDGYVSNGNSLVVVTRDGVLIYDTFTRPSTARAALARIREITDKPVRYIVNSHWHPDHWGGNEVYAEAFPGVQIIATQETAQFMHDIAPGWLGVFAARRQTLLQQRASRTEALDADADLRERLRADMYRELLEVHRAYPNRTYEGSMTLRFGGREFRLQTEFGDASYSTILYMPRERIMAVGDLVVHPFTWTANGYAISPWIDSLHRVDAVNWAVLLPGHGEVQRDHAYVRLVAEYFEAARTQTRAALMNGAVTQEEAVAQVNLSAFQARFGEAADDEDFADTTHDLVRKFYQEMRDGMISHR